MSNNETYDMIDGRSLHQEMMDAAYARWQKGGDLEDKSYAKFTDALDLLHEKAVIIGNLNQQVENGGFAQWVDNGYCKDSGRTILFYLRGMEKEGCPLAPTIRKMVLEAIREQERVDDISEDDFTDDDWCIDYEAYEDEAQPDVDHLDSQYYAINAAWMVQFEVWLRRQAGEDIPQEVLDHHADQLARGADDVTLDSEHKRRKPRVRLSGTDGNAFSVISKVAAALRKAGYPNDDVKRFKAEAMAGNYDHVLSTAMQWADVR